MDRGTCKPTTKDSQIGDYQHEEPSTAMSYRDVDLELWKSNFQSIKPVCAVRLTPTNYSGC